MGLVLKIFIFNQIYSYIFINSKKLNKFNRSVFLHARENSYRL